MPSQSHQDEASNLGGSHTQQPQGGIPFYRRCPLWILLGFLLGLHAFFFFYKYYMAPPAVVSAPSNTVAAEESLALQRAHNQGLQEEIETLLLLLAEDPCTIKEEITRYVPTTVSPSYGKAGPRLSLAKEPSREDPVLPGTNAPPKNPAALPVEAAAPPATVIELLEQATVFVFTNLPDAYGTGTGFVVAPGIIATNQHVVQGPNFQVYVGNKTISSMVPTQILAVSNDPNQDYALLQVSPEIAKKLPFLHLAPKVARSEKVGAWGYPSYISAIDPNLEALMRGDVSSVPEVVYSEGSVNVVLDRSPTMILHSAGLSQGNSGGPLVNSQGLVVGINTLIRMADQSYSQANIALASQGLAEFMRDHGVEPTIARPEEN